MNPPGQSWRVLHLNSLLTGGGTDDQCVKLAGQLHKMGQRVWLAGPSGRPFAPVIEELGVPFFDTGQQSGKGRFILRVARLIRREKIQIVHGHHGRDLWPTILAARLAGTKPKIVLTRHMAKSPGSLASRHFLLGQCDALIAVSEFVAKVLREGVYEAGVAGGRAPGPSADCGAITPKSMSFTAESTRQSFFPPTRRIKGASWDWNRANTRSRWWAVLICRAARGSGNSWPPPRASTKKFQARVS